MTANLENIMICVGLQGLGALISAQNNRFDQKPRSNARWKSREMFGLPTVKNLTVSVFL